MHTGTVKFFNEAKGFGFIVDDATGQEVFVHVSTLGGLQIKEKDKVSFEVIDGKKGLNADKVTKM